MQSKDKQYRIFLKSTHQWVPVSKAEFDNYYRDINAYRRRQQEHGRCICPPSKRYLCDMDCGACPYHKGGNELSLDYSVTDDSGNEKRWLDDLPDDKPSIQSVIEDRELLNALYQRLDGLDPDGRRICDLIMQGRSERDAAAELGMPRNTFVYRRDKLLAVLRESLKDFI